MAACRLALRAETEKFEFVSHAGEAVRGGNARLNLAGETFPDFNHFRAAGANQVMVMTVVAFADQFKSRRAVAEVKSLHHSQIFEQMHGAVNRRQIALAFGQGGEDFPVRERMRMLPQNFQNRRAGAGDLSRLLAQTTRQRRQFLLLAGVGMWARFHFWNGVFRLRSGFQMEK
jgi:site-specific recombinase